MTGINPQLEIELFKEAEEKRKKAEANKKKRCSKQKKKVLVKPTPELKGAELPNIFTINLESSKENLREDKVNIELSLEAEDQFIYVNDTGKNVQLTENSDETVLDSKNEPIIQITENNILANKLIVPKFPIDSIIIDCSPMCYIDSVGVFAIHQVLN